jgi:predicted Zn-dependent protease
VGVAFAPGGRFMSLTSGPVAVALENGEVAAVVETELAVDI